MAKVVDLYERAFFSVPRVCYFVFMIVFLFFPNIFLKLTFFFLIQQSQAKRIEEGLRGCLLRMKRLSGFFYLLLFDMKKSRCSNMISN